MAHIVDPSLGSLSVCISMCSLYIVVVTIKSVTSTFSPSLHPWLSKHSKAKMNGGKKKQTTHTKNRLLHQIFQFRSRMFAGRRISLFRSMCKSTFSQITGILCEWVSNHHLECVCVCIYRLHLLWKLLWSSSDVVGIESMQMIPSNYCVMPSEYTMNESVYDARKYADKYSRRSDSVASLPLLALSLAPHLSIMLMLHKILVKSSLR